jgi:hypothetical protein
MLETLEEISLKQTDRAMLPFNQCRYNAAIQFNNDCTMVWVGTVCYLFAVRPALVAPPPGGGVIPALKVLGLAWACVWPWAMRYVCPEFFLRWRDQLFTAQ